MGGSGSASLVLFALLGAGGRSFGPPVLSDTAEEFWTPRSVALGDFDGDGRPDMGLAGTGRSEVLVFAGVGDGTFVASAREELQVFPYSIAATDLHGDGALDLVVAAWGDASVVVLRGGGDGSFDAQAAIPLRWQPGRMLATDVDGDGAPDVVVPYSAAGGAGCQVLVLRNRGDGELAEDGEYATACYASAVAVGDLDADGAPDLVVATEGDHTVALLRGMPRGHRRSPSRVDMLATPRALTVAELDGDGRADLVAGSGSDTVVRVLLGRADGEFATIDEMQPGRSPNAIAAGDFDHDGLVDLATVNGHHDSLSVLMGRGDGTFAGRDLPDTGDDPRQLVVADFDGDEHLDLAVGSYGSARINLLLGLGDGHFEAGATLDPGLQSDGLTVGDLDGDGTPDLVSVGRPPGEAGGVSVLRGLGGGAFAPATLWLQGRRPFAVALGHLDGDGVLDVAVAAAGDVRAALGRGDGTFGEMCHQSYVLGTLNSLAIRDMDGDGVNDLLVAAAYDVKVARGQGDCTFGDLVPYRLDTLTLASTLPDHLTVADLDGDGVLDAAVANRIGGDLSLLVSPVSAEPIRQTLTDLPAATVAVGLGASSVHVHQPTQEIQQLAVRYAVRFAAPAAGPVWLELTAPNGDQALLAQHDHFDAFPPGQAEPSGYQIVGQHPAEPTLGDLDALLGLQPTGYWSLAVRNDSGQVGELVDFAVHTRGRLHGPQPGDRPSNAEPLWLWPLGERASAARLVMGTTLGYGDHATLDCAATAGSPDHFYDLTVGEPLRLSASALASFDAALELRAGPCAGAQPESLTCDDNGGHGRSPRLPEHALEPGSYCLIVDGVFDVGELEVQGGERVHSGEYHLTVRYGAP